MKPALVIVAVLCAFAVASFAAEKDLMLRPSDETSPQNAQRGQGDRVPPVVELTSPINSQGIHNLRFISTSRYLRIAGIASDDQGVAEVTVNGKPTRLGPPNGKDLSLVEVRGRSVGFETEIPLTESETVHIVARDLAGNETERTLEVAYQPREVLQQETGQRWAVIVGIEDYEDPEITDLRYSVDDAKAFYEVLVDPERGGFDPKHVRLLTSDATDPSLRPTRLNILDALNNWLHQTTERDTVLFYFSGHGIADKQGRNYLVAVDSKLNLLEDSAVLMERVNEVLNDPERIPAKKVVVILDSCHSGPRAGAKGEGIYGQVLDPLFTEAEGRVTLASSSADEQSFEDEKIGHGVFTHYLVEGLKGQGDNDGDGIVTATELSNFVYNKVREWASERGKQQTPRRESNLAGEIWLSRDPKYGTPEYRQKQLDALHNSGRITDAEYQDALQLLQAENLPKERQAERTALEDLLDRKISLAAYRTILGRQRGVGILKIESEPEGATLFINGQYSGVTPRTLTDQPIGRYTIEISREGYVTQTQEVEVTAGKTAELNVTLEQLSSGRGTLLVKTTPMGAQIYIDGKFTAYAPKRIEKVPAGRRKIRLELAGRPPHEETVQVRDGEVTKVSFAW